MYRPTQAPWMILIIMKVSIFCIKINDPETIARALMNRMKFLLENQWRSFFPAKAPNKAPKDIHPVNIPRAVYKLKETLNTFITSENYTVDI